MNDATQLLLIKGVVSDFPAKERAKLDSAKNRIEAIIQEDVGIDSIAIALVGLEMAVNAEKGPSGS